MSRWNGILLKTILLLAVLSSASQAQLPEKGNIYFGISGGGTNTQLTGDYIADTEEFYGLFTGVSAQYVIVKNLAFDVELNFIEKNSRSTVTTGESITLKLDMIEIPVLLEGFLPLGSKVFVGVYGGASVAFLARCKIGVGGLGTSMCCNDSELGITSRFAEFNAIGGAGLAIRLADEGTYLIFNARYSAGLTSIYKEENRDVKTRCWTFYARASIPIQF